MSPTSYQTALPRDIKLNETTLLELTDGGGGEIRTHASDETPIGFQDRPLKPLGYASIDFS